MSESAYRSAGVDIDAQDAALERIGKLVKSTFTRGVLSQPGGFGGLFRPDLTGRSDPVLVASADGVGTKLEVARKAGDFSTVGIDLVNHCVNDILVQGAVPLFFLDYVGAGRLEPRRLEELVAGLAAACRENGCALLGGETAEMPGFYKPGDYELAGFIVGLVDGGEILDGSAVAAGDLLIGLPSSGLHTNGYSLARKILFETLGLSVGDPLPSNGSANGRSVGEELLEPHRSYLEPLRPVLGHPGLHGMAHVTGGGLTDNLPRILPGGTQALVRVGTWEVPEIFHLLQRAGEVSTEEMFRVFNMGIGMVLAVDPAAAAEVFESLRSSRQKAVPIGTVQKGKGGVVYDLAAAPVSE